MANFVKLFICQYIIGKKNTRGKCRGKCPKFWQHITVRLLKYEPYVWCDAGVFLKSLITSVKSLHFYSGKYIQHKGHHSGHFSVTVTFSCPHHHHTFQNFLIFSNWDSAPWNSNSPSFLLQPLLLYNHHSIFCLWVWPLKVLQINGITQFSCPVSDVLHLAQGPYGSSTLSYCRISLLLKSEGASSHVRISVYPVADILATVNAAAVNTCRRLPGLCLQPLGLPQKQNGCITC